MATGIGLGYKTTAQLATIAYKEIKMIIRDTIQENKMDGSIKLEITKSTVGIPQVGAILALQMWYNKPTHRFFIEYDLNRYMEVEFDRGKFKETFEDKVKKYFYRDTNMYCEILHPEDGYTEQCDSAFLSLPTPYTIGYWKSLSGRYEFIEDKQQVYADSRATMNPSDEPVSGLPTKTFDEFSDEVYAIAKRYGQTALTEAQKDAYLAEVNNIASRYPRESQAYKDAIVALDNSYNLKHNTSLKVPEMFEEYKALYQRYFNKTLQNLSMTQCRTVYIQLYPVAPTESEEDVEDITEPGNDLNLDDWGIEEEELNSYA